MPVLLTALHQLLSGKSPLVSFCARAAHSPLKNSWETPLIEYDPLFTVFFSLVSCLTDSNPFNGFRYCSFAEGLLCSQVLLQVSCAALETFSTNGILWVFPFSGIIVWCCLLFDGWKKSLTYFVLLNIYLWGEDWSSNGYWPELDVLIKSNPWT